MADTISIELVEEESRFVPLGEVGGTFTPADVNLSESQRILRGIEAECKKLSGQWKEDNIRENQIGISKSGGPFHFPGYGFHEIQTYITDIPLTAVSVAAIAHLFKALIIQWLKNRASRRVILKIGNAKVELHGTDDLEAALKLLSGASNERLSTSRAIAEGKSDSKASVEALDRSEASAPNRRKKKNSSDQTTGNKDIA